MKRGIDFLLLLLVVSLSLFGLLMIYDASSFIAFRDFGDKFHYLKEQSIWLTLGLLGLVFFSFFDYHKFYNLSLPLIILAILLLIMVFIPGLGISYLGARRWIDLGFFLIQPAEFVKLALVIYLSSWFCAKEKGRFLAFSLLLGLVFLLVILEPDMGTAGIILATGLVVYFLSGGSLISFLFLIPIISFLSFLLIKFSPYRAARLATFLNPNQGIETSSYHARQILIALGMGGLTGVGLGNSLQKYAYLPENTTDSIFAIIAEEFGFLGASFVIFLLMLFVWRGFVIAQKAKDNLGKLLAGGITTFLAVQMFINLGAQTLLLPITGVPLPFISYGGSALIVDLVSVGILLNISKQNIS